LLLNRAQKLKTFFTLVFISVLVFELFRYGLKFNSFSPPGLLYPETPVTAFLQQYPADRFIAEPVVLPANMWVPFRLSSIAGYEGIYPVKSAQLLASANSNFADVTPQPRWGILENFDSNLLDATGTRFFVTLKRDSTGKVIESGQIDKKFQTAKYLSKYREVFNDKGVVVLENTQSLQHAYATKEVIKASDKDTLKLMLDENFPIKNTAITQGFEFKNPSTQILETNLNYRPITNSHVLVDAASNMDAFLVVLDSYYPGWKALIDGNKTKIYRTNYNFRGIYLPKGTHKVEFIYNPDSLKYGAIITGVSVFIIVALLLIPKLKRIN